MVASGGRREAEKASRRLLSPRGGWGGGENFGERLRLHINIYIE